MAPVSNNDPRQAVAPSPGPSTENADLQTSVRFLVAQTSTNESNVGTPGTGELSRADPTSLPSASISTLKSLTGMQVGNKIVINETVAESVSHVLTHGMEAETIQRLDRTIKMLLNCDRFGVILCYQEVFKWSPMDIKRLDKELQGVQKVLMQSLSALTQVLSGTTGQADPDMAELVANAVGLSSHVSHQLDLARRKLFQPSTREDFMCLCTQDYPVVDFLFSKNKTGKLKTMWDSAQITKSIGKAAASPSARKRLFPFHQRPRQQGKGFSLFSSIPVSKKKGFSLFISVPVSNKRPFPFQKRPRQQGKGLSLFISAPVSKEKAFPFSAASPSARKWPFPFQKRPRQQGNGLSLFISAPVSKEKAFPFSEASPSARKRPFPFQQRPRQQGNGLSLSEAIPWARKRLFPFLSRVPDTTGRAIQQPPHYDQRGEWEPRHFTYRDRIPQGQSSRGSPDTSPMGTEYLKVTQRVDRGHLTYRDRIPQGQATRGSPDTLPIGTEYLKVKQRVGRGHLTYRDRIPQGQATSGKGTPNLYGQNSSRSNNEWEGDT